MNPTDDIILGAQLNPTDDIISVAQLNPTDDIILDALLNPTDDIILGAISNTVRGPFLKCFCPVQRCFWGFEFGPSYALEGHIAHSCKATEAVSLNRMEEA